MPRVEEPTAISSTCKPCFLKIPASWAAHSGRKAPAGAGYATRNGRSAPFDRRRDRISIKDGHDRKLRHFELHRHHDYSVIYLISLNASLMNRVVDDIF